MEAGRLKTTTVLTDGGLGVRWEQVTSAPGANVLIEQNHSIMQLVCIAAGNALMEENYSIMQNGSIMSHRDNRST